MAFPYVFEENFELGTIGSFDSETDTGARLDIAHYSDLAGVPGLPGPFNGAFSMRVNLATSTADAFVTETAGFDIAANARLHIRFMLWVSNDIVMANNDEFLILQLINGSAVNEVVCAINFTTGSGLRIGVGETAATSLLPLTTNTWHSVELDVTLDDGGTNDGTIDLTLDEVGTATQVTGLDQAAIASATICCILRFSPGALRSSHSDFTVDHTIS